METIQYEGVTSGVPFRGGEFEALMELLKGFQVLRAIAAPTPKCSVTRKAPPTREGVYCLVPATPDFLPRCFDNIYPGVFVLCRDDRAGSIRILIYPPLHRPWS